MKSTISFAMSGFSAIILSVFTRSLLFLGLSWYIFSGTQPTAATDFFQALFLQSVMITFLSASSYFTTVSKRWDSSNDAKLILSHIQMSLLTVLAVCLLYIFGKLETQSRLVLLLLTGALATGIAAPLTGLVVRKFGPWMAYGPSITVAPLYLSFIFVPNIDPMIASVCAIVGFQVTVFLVLSFIMRELLFSIIRSFRSILRVSTFSNLWSNFVFGLLNSAIVGYFYWFRELWVAVQAAETAATILFIFRISDTFIGVIITDIGAKLDALKLVERHGKVLSIIIVCAGMLVSAVLWWITTFEISDLALAISGQLLVECIRLLSIGFFLYQNARRSSVAYALYCLGTVGITYAFLMVVPLQNYPAGFFYFLVANSVTSTVLTAVFVLAFSDKSIS